LVVEDEPVVALELETLLTEEGAQVIGPATNVEEGLRLVQNEAITSALLDVRLGRETVAPVAKALQRRGIPFVFYTGQTESDAVRREWPDVVCLDKPATSLSLIRAIERLKGEPEGEVRAPREPRSW
jgi:DNA-binding response OmpR family regulator